MKYKFLFFLLSIFLLISCKEKLNEEYHFFNLENFDSGKYKLLVFGLEGEWIDDFRDFYIDDISTLKQMQQQWTFKYKSEVMPCGYGYKIVLVNKEEIINEKYINIDCEYMSGWIYFPENYLSDYKSSFKKMTEIEKENFIEKYYSN